LEEWAFLAVDRLIKAFFCKFCTHLDVMNGQVECEREDCDCNEEIRLDTILDLYANFYFHLNNINLNEYETLIAEDPHAGLEVKSQLRDAWISHLHSRHLLYKRKAYLNLQDTTRQLVLQSLHQAATREDLLLLLMEWLFLLDDHLYDLRIHLVHRRPEPEMVLPTTRGPLVYRCPSPIMEYLESHEAYRPLTDPNYLHLKNKVANFHLTKKRYPAYHTVEHRYVPLQPPDGEKMGDLQFGLLAGLFDVEQDYRYFIPDRLHPDGMLPFAFEGVKDVDAYYQKVLECFSLILDKNPEFIILPEFMSPLDLQERLKSVLGERQRQREAEGKSHRTLLMMTGSFHVMHQEIFSPSASVPPDRRYNYAQVTDGSGNKWLDVFKMNRFVLHRKSTRSGELRPFREHDGVELNAYTERNLVFLDTSLGRMAFLICVDLINESMLDILIEHQIDLLFVMTMTPKPADGKFLRSIHALGERARTMIVICNNLGEPTIEEENVRAVVYVPGFKKMFLAHEEWKVCKLVEILDQITS
jgi:predicted amidohydrolase